MAIQAVTGVKNAAARLMLPTAMTAAQVAGEKDISAVKKKDKFFFNNPFGLYASFMCIDTLLHKNTLQKRPISGNGTLLKG